MRIRGEREGKGGGGLENEEGCPPCVSVQPVGLSLEIGLEALLCSTAGLIPDSGAVTIFPFSKHGGEPYSTGLVEVRVLQKETHVKSFLKPKVLQKI